MTTAECKRLVEDYLVALSGHPKPPALVERFVSERHLQSHIRDIEAAFPAYELITEAMVAEGDLVAVRGLFRGTQRGPFAGIPPTGRTVSASLQIFYRVHGGLIVEHWLQFDGASLIAQLQQQVPAEAQTAGNTDSPAPLSASPGGNLQGTNFVSGTLTGKR